VTTWRVTKCGVIWATIRPNGVSRREQVVLVAAVAVALAVGVVLVAEDLGAVGQHLARGHHAHPHDLLGGPVEHHRLARVAALGGADLGVGVVDVVAGAVGEHRVDEVRLDLRGQGVVEAEPSRVVAGVLVLEVPPDARHPLSGVRGEVGVDQQRRCRDRVVVGPAHDDPVLGLDAADLGDRHAGTLASRSHECAPERATDRHRYWPVATRSMARPPSGRRALGPSRACG
jgi:hypothetical protein